MKTTFVATLALFAGTACASADPNDGGSGVEEPSASQIELSREREKDLQELRAGTELWQSEGPDFYVYVGQLSCFCGGSLNPIRVVVEAGQVVRAQDTVDLSDQREAADTIDSRLEQALAQALREDTGVAGTYDAALGYPVEFSSNLRGYSDGSSLFRISCFSEGTGGDVCPMPEFSAAECAAQGGTPTERSNLNGGLCGGTREPLIALTPLGAVCCP